MDKIQKAIQLLEKSGYKLLKQAVASNDNYNIDFDFTGKSHKIGLVSDTHLGSRYCQITHLNTAYEYFKSSGIDTVLHAGDLTEGERLFRGQEYEIATHGADEQIKFAVDKYPKVKGIKTYIISGNHDLSFMKTAGIDVVKLICDNRKDFVYLGQLGAFINFGSVKIYLHHPTSGLAYARSYKQQKVIEQFSPDNKPNIYISGHYHTSNVLPMYRNVFGIQLGCFQAQTPYLTAKGLYPELSFCVLEFTEKDGIVSVGFQMFPFFHPKEDFR